MSKKAALTAYEQSIRDNAIAINTLFGRAALLDAHAGRRMLEGAIEYLTERLNEIKP